MALDHHRLIRPGNKKIIIIIKKTGWIFFAFENFTLQNLANKSECV